jgi:hypothetical protein
MRELINCLLQSEICQIEFKTEGTRHFGEGRLKQNQRSEICRKKTQRKFVSNKEGVHERNNGSISTENLPATQ